MKIFNFITKKPIKAGVLSGIVLSASLIIVFTLVTPKADAPVTTYDIPEELKKLLESPEPVELPFGGRSVIPDYRFVALYGSPEYPSLGALGEQPLADSITRVKNLTAEYQILSPEKIIPTFEIITTVASAEPTDNQDYSREIDPAKLKPIIDTAKEQGIYVVLDLQPGRTDFLSQAKIYESLLLEPHVGLALDPEWRLQTPQARHLKSVGSVSADEINQTSAWLSEIVKTHDLPQKIFMVHQFKNSMITNRETLKTDYPELGYIIHMDGHSALSQKVDTWNTIRVNLPANVYMGWKNFYDEDRPTPTPADTMAQQPTPHFISYQ
ncbi:hypothetical protein KBB49_00095 [Candidatus Saccharibacteria bacterium]|nr:hypothetical protein [Candidatus Saccharibacteria bacterium]